MSARWSQLTVVLLPTALLSVVLAVAGGLLARGMIEAGRDTAALQRDASLAPKEPAAIAQDVPTSFGVVAVESMTKNAGPTAKALAGMTHGVGNLVPPNKLQVDVTVTLTNLKEQGRAVLAGAVRAPRHPAATSRRRGTRSFRLARASVPPGTLQPNASIDATLTYVVPRDGSKLWMTFDDAARAPPILFDLGRIDRTPRGALNQYHAHKR